MSWNATKIHDLTGQRALVTGATSGLGYQTALQLLRHGAEVIVAARNPEKSAAAAAALAGATGRDIPAVLNLDLSDLSAVRTAAGEAVERYDRLDLLVNNAGVMATPYRETADGFELQLGTNHLGHFALTAQLMPLLEKASRPRVVTVSSFLHRSVRGISRADLHAAHDYRKWDAYAKSKLANLLFMLELDRRARAAGSPLLSVGAHPGFAATDLQKSGPQLGGTDLEARMLAAFTRLAGQSAEAGAWSSLYAATQPDLRPGSFVGPAYGLRGAPKLILPSSAALDAQSAEQLWSWSVEATGVDCF